MQCPDQNTLVAVVDGGATSEMRAATALHLDECASCRLAVEGLVQALAPTVFSDRSPASSSTRERTEPTAGDVVAQRYKLERVIGEGGLGVVWSATHVLTQKPVALKLTKFRYPELEKRFLREARVSSVLHHPNIVDVHEVVQLEGSGVLAMVMDLLEGEPLDRYLEARKRLTVSDTLRIMHPVLSALDAAHELGIVHLALKPQNIFLATDASGNVRPMLLDFGVAKLTSVLTKEQQLLGTTHYMAPEQLSGEPDIDARTDVWAVGVIFFECLSGHRPGSETRELPNVPPSLASLIDAMLTRDRATRPASLQPVLAEAERIMTTPSQ